jgi:hypothetical protein
MENHPGKSYNHKTYIWLCLGQIIGKLDVVVILPERGQWGGVVGV